MAHQLVLFFKSLVGQPNTKQNMKDNVKISDLVAHGLLKPGDEALYRDTQLVCIKVETNKQKARINENNEMEWFEGDQKVVHQTVHSFHVRVLTNSQQLLLNIAMEENRLVGGSI